MVNLHQKKNFFILFFLLFFGFTFEQQNAEAQGVSEPDIQKRLDMIKNGQIDEVKAELPTLLTKYQNNPGVLYLQGVLTTDGAEAVKIFQSVVDNFPKSEWADDALYKVYQFYYSLGLYKTAELKFQQLKREYPNSPYVTGKEIPQIAEKKKEEMPPENIGSSKATESGLRGTFAVQVGAFSTLENANKQKKFFEGIGQHVEILNKVRHSKSLYLVWVGLFKSYEEARKFGAEIKSKYKIDSMVVAR